MREHSRRWRCVLTATLSIAAYSHTALSSEEALRPFTVSDSIEMTVIDHPKQFPSYLSTEVSKSRDGSQFFIVTKRGDLVRGCNQYTLRTYRLADVEDALKSSRPVPFQEPASFCSSSNLPGIAQARWLPDSRTIAFLGAEERKPSQVFTLNVQTREVKQLTHHPHPVLEFDIGSQTYFIYSAIVETDWKNRRERGFVVETEPFLDVLAEGHKTLFPETALFVGSATGDPHRLIGPAPRNADLRFGLWLSPRGKWAIAFLHNQTAAWWRDYAPVAGEELSRRAADPKMSAFIGEHPYFFLEFVLINMETAVIEWRMNAPSGLWVAGLTASANWLPDESAVILANTFLPLEGKNEQERQIRSRAPCIVELDLATKRLRRVLTLQASNVEGSPDQRSFFLGTRIDASGDLEVRRSGPQGQELIRFHRKGKTWIRDAASPRKQRDRLNIHVKQDLNLPPELAITDSVFGRSHVITDLNPQLRRLSLGTAEIISWVDGRGTTWRGGLLRPPGFRRDKRYPLVIQTHGFNEGEFLVDGPEGTASGYAARALANRGIAVLQVRDTEIREASGREELETAMAGYAAAIRELDEGGIVDQSRVGMHGFSFTGVYLQHAITFSDLNLAAASATDASEVSLFSNMAWYGMFYPGMLEQEAKIGGIFWGPGTSVWQARDPLFHLNRIRTPLLIQNFTSAYQWFDVFALLRRNQRPVELMSFPDSAHQVVQPWHRLASQESIVDWYDFWLNDHEDSSEGKRAQYMRWRSLRENHRRQFAAGE